MTVTEVGPEVYLIDAFEFGVPRRTGVYFIDGAAKVLIDTGSAAFSEKVREGLRFLGVNALDFLVLTHIHIDHAGAAGWFAELFPGARILVHPKGAPYLISPERLRESTRKARSSYPVHPKEFLPVPAERLVQVEDEMQLALGERTLTFVHTPGHAPHCVCIYDDRSGGVFVGDSLGVRIASRLLGEERVFFLPAMVPPRFEPEAALASSARIAALRAASFYYSHFGVSQRPAEDLEEYQEVVRRAKVLAEEIRNQALNREAARERFARWLAEEVLGIPLEKLLAALERNRVSLSLNVGGLVEYACAQPSPEGAAGSCQLEG